MSTLYKVIASASETNALSNKIYFNKDVKFAGKYVCLENLSGKFIYNPIHSDDVLPGSVMLSGKQREVISKKIGDVVDISFSNESLKQIKELYIDVDSIKRCVVDCELLTQSFKDNIIGSPLCVGQVITQYCGDGINCSCKMIRIVGTDGNDLRSGIFDNDTILSYSTTSKKIIKLVNMEIDNLFKLN
jgi:hypothetical protein